MGGLRNDLTGHLPQRLGGRNFLFCNLQVVHTTCSDHEPLQLDLLHVTKSKKEFRFRFENTC